MSKNYGMPNLQHGKLWSRTNHAQTSEMLFSIHVPEFDDFRLTDIQSLIGKYKISDAVQTNTIYIL